MAETGATPIIYVVGNVNVDLIMGPLAQWPKVGTEVVLPHSDIRIGGGTGNAALALQALGAHHRLLSTVGEDIFGQWLQAGFDPDFATWIVKPCRTTISTGIVDPGGERTFLTSQGHLAAFTLEDALQLIPRRAAPGDLLLLEGCFLNPLLLERFEALLDAAVERGFTLALDTGWPPDGWSPALQARVLGWAARFDHLLLNEIEVLGLSGERSSMAALAKLRVALKPAATLVMKRGVAGASGFRGGERVEVAAPPVTVIDTIGAGDVFNAGYLAALVQGADLGPALEAGVAAASMAISTAPRRYR
jgi:sugar/nucleoside kinase (ribokinase family)